MKPYFENTACHIASIVMLIIKTCAFFMTLFFSFPLVQCFGGIGFFELLFVLLMIDSVWVLVIYLAVLVFALLWWIYSLIRLFANGRGANLASISIVVYLWLDVFSVLSYLLGGAGITKVFALIFDFVLLLVLALLRRSRPGAPTVI